MVDRKEVLINFLDTNYLQDNDLITEEELTFADFKSESKSVIFEALKIMIMSHCREDAKVTVIKNINQKIRTIGERK